MEDFRQVCFDYLTVVEDFVAVACHLESFAVSIHSDYGDVGEADLIHWLSNFAGHVLGVCFCVLVSVVLWWTVVFGG